MDGSWENQVVTEVGNEYILDQETGMFYLWKSGSTWIMFDLEQIL